MIDLQNPRVSGALSSSATTMAAAAPKKQAPWKGFVAGSTGAMLSGAVTHPIDLVKVRMQLYGAKDGFEAAAGVAALGGARHVAHGLPGGEARGDARAIQGPERASLMRQASFIGTKFGAYDLLKSAVPKDPDGTLPFWKMTLCGLGAGAIGAAVGNPADLAMVRMQADGRLPPELRRNYRHGGEALMRVVREEGVLALWRGCGPTVNRAMIVTASQMAVYDKTKATILDRSGMRDGLAVQTGASFIAGIVAALTSNPIDLAKSRLMSMKPDANGNLPYTGTLDCIVKTVRHEGLGAVYGDSSPPPLGRCRSTWCDSSRWNGARRYWPTSTDEPRRWLRWKPDANPKRHVALARARARSPTPSFHLFIHASDARRRRTRHTTRAAPDPRVPSPPTIHERPSSIAT